jgi:hypothetical protein
VIGEGRGGLLLLGVVGGCWGGGGGGLCGGEREGGQGLTSPVRDNVEDGGGDIVFAARLWGNG